MGGTLTIRHGLLVLSVLLRRGNQNGWIGLGTLLGPEGTKVPSRRRPHEPLDLFRSGVGEGSLLENYIVDASICKASF